MSPEQIILELLASGSREKVPLSVIRNDPFNVRISRNKGFSTYRFGNASENLD